jgi:hypothetical protein
MAGGRTGAAADLTRAGADMLHALAPSPSSLDKMLARLADLSSATPRVHAGVRFDPANGIGGIPDAANADYRGFTAYMRPRQFLQVNPPRDLDERPIDHILKAIGGGDAIGTPILYVDKNPAGGWQVRGHEGRGRMHAMDRIAPDAYLPVAVHPYGEIRARDLAPDNALDWLRADRGGELPARAAISILNKRPYVQPGDAEFFHQYGTHPALEQLIDELSR